MITLYNTLTKTKEHLLPRQDKKIQMFVCGPTVYDYIHIGNARTFVFFDVVARYLRSQGYEVDYIQNITDIDDKIIARAEENKREPLDWAKEYYEKFRDDMKGLGVDSPRYVPATEQIEQVVKQVKTLIAEDFAYKIEDDGWYFDLSKFPDYGKLSGRKAQMADDAVSRIDENSKKKNKGDFALWKFSKEGEPSWETELGQGRPGWHIEDTAITEHYFGPQYDIHGGGQDLIFPHHEAEITQQESASGKKPFVKYWMHVAFLINKEQKMSKSLGNFETVNSLLKKYPKEVLRFYLLSNYYRSPLDYSDTMFNQAQAGISRISEFIQKLEKASGEENKDIESVIDETKTKFVEAMNNDFNTPETFASIFEMIRIMNPLVAENKVSKKQAEEILRWFNDINDILGIIIMPEIETTDFKGIKITTSSIAGIAIDPNITNLLEQRELARKEKDFVKADELRIELERRGWKIQDTATGPTASASPSPAPDKEK